MNKSNKTNSVEKLSIKLTEWVGTPTSIVIHTVFFVTVFGLYFVGFRLDEILLLLTTAVSLEAIYLSLFIQMTVNRNTESLEDVEENLDDIQEDVEGLGDDFDEIQEDVEGLQGNIHEIKTDVDSLEENVEDISEDVDKLESDHPKHINKDAATTIGSIETQLAEITKSLSHLQKEIHALKDK